jgi:putative endonuclease
VAIQVRVHQAWIAASLRSRAVKRTFQPAVYIMASGRNGTVYVGVTSDLPKRAYEHREGILGGFTKQHGCKVLVWFEIHSTMEYAITREEQLKAGSRAKKVSLVEGSNPQWRDLFAEVCG